MSSPLVYRIEIKLNSGRLIDYTFPTRKDRDQAFTSLMNIWPDEFPFIRFTKAPDASSTLGRFVEESAVNKGEISWINKVDKIPKDKR